MSTATLQLSEHELSFLPSGTPMLAPATRLEVEINGERYWFLARLIWDGIRHKSSEFYSVFFRSEDAQLDEIFGHQTSVHKTEAALSTQEEIELMAKAIEIRHALRYWDSPDVPYRLSVGSQEWIRVYWDDRNEHAECHLEFRHKLPWADEDVFRFPRNGFFDFCWQMHEDQNSAVHRALRWAQLNAEQRDEIAFRCEHEDWTTLHHLLSLALLVLVAQYKIPPRPLSGQVPWLFDEKLTCHLLFKECGATEAVQHWQTAICDVIRPGFWVGEESYVTKWRHHWSHKSQLYTARCGIPTHHEFLEAQLELREFLRLHLPAAEIEALFVP